MIVTQRQHDLMRIEQATRYVARWKPHARHAPSVVPRGTYFAGWLGSDPVFVREKRKRSTTT